MPTSESQPSSSYQVFHLFPYLPPELRLKIWNLNLPKTRIIPIKCGGCPSQPRQPTSGLCLSPTQVPSLLHACHESRTEAARDYRLMFGLAGRPGTIFLDPARDILYFGPRVGFMATLSQLRTFLTLVSPAELASIRRVAIDEAMFATNFGVSYAVTGFSDNNFTSDVIHLIRTRLPGLEKLVFVTTIEMDFSVVAVNSALAPGPFHRVYKPAAERVPWLARQVAEAFHSVCKCVPEWKPPAWGVSDIADLKKCVEDLDH